MNFDEIKNAIYVISSLAAMLGAPFLILKAYFDIHTVRRNRLRDEFKFADDFFEKIAKNKDMHPYAKEKGYQAIAGTSQISGEEIAHLLLLYAPEYQRENLADQRPGIAIEHYIRGKKYLKFHTDNGIPKVDFQKKYTSKWSRAIIKYPFLFLYFLFGFGIWAALIMPVLLPKKFVVGWQETALGVLYFGSGAWFSLRKAVGIHLAERIVKNQNKGIIQHANEPKSKVIKKVINRRKPLISGKK